MIIDIDKLKTMLLQEECNNAQPALKPYVDTVGKITIGVGRNLSDKGISNQEALMMFDRDIMEAIGHLMIALPWFELLDEVRQRVLADMCFNMGIGNDKHGLLSFKNALAHLEKHEYEQAALHFENSLWAKQVGPRAVKLCIMIRTGRDN